jgi:hypothetical protein
MSILIYKNNTFDTHFTSYNSDVTLALSTSNRRYRGSFVNLVQAQAKDASVFEQGLNNFYSEYIVLDLFDTWVELLPETIGSFLDDYDDGKYPDSQLIIVLDDENLIQTWELENVIRKF